MKKSIILTTVLALIINMIGIAAASTPVEAASKTRTTSAPQALPSWFADAPAKSAHPLPTRELLRNNAEMDAVASARQPASSALPAWFSPASEQPASRDASPPPRTLTRDISLSLLSVDVTGPDAASVGAPAGHGEVYTAVVRNDSSQIAYGLYLTATHRSFMVYDGGSELISSTGAITLTPVVTSTTAITWTPSITYNLHPGEVITLNFRLRATCNAESGKRLEVGVNYNADPDEPPIETNASGVNVTTGRGNLVIKKEPSLQNLSTPDFGEPITWTVTLQNTGLGKIYSATITDTGGTNLNPPTIDPPTTTIFMLDVNETRTYTVVGTVEACNFTNVVEAWWPCGNKVGDAKETNPVSSTASVLFRPDVPKVDVEVSPPLTFTYCAPITRSVTITVSGAGGPAGDFRLDSSLESEGFLEIITPTITGDWNYDPASGIFSYTGGLVSGTLMANDTVTLTFEVQPDDIVCTADGDDLGFRPLYRDVCSNEPFTGTPRSLAYTHAQGEAPDLNVAKSGPRSVASGEVFTYQVTVDGSNAQNISGTVYVTDTLPDQFEPQGSPSPSLGSVSTSTDELIWTFPSTHTAGTTFSETLLYQVRAITATGGICGAGEQVSNTVELFAQPTCPACPDLTDDDDIETVIENQEGVTPYNSAVGSYEVCGAQGFTITNRYEITGSTVVTWASAVFTEALGTDIGAGALPGGTEPLEYRDALSVVIDGVDYTAYVTETETGGPLVLDLSGLDGLAPTQTFVLYITYTVGISEASLDGEVERTFYDWTQLYLPNSQSGEVCAGNEAFNQAIALTIGRGDLSVGLAPRELDRCETNRAVINVTDHAPARLADHIVVTFTSSSAEIATARNFATTDDLPDISSIDVVTDPGNGIITFTFDSGYDSIGSGNIEFDIDVGCTGKPPWEAGITFQSQCGFTHDHQTSLGHTYNKPDLILFATPIRYTLREKDVLWKFFLTNNGNLTATDVVVTNTVSGLSAYTYTADGPDVSSNLPITNADAVFTVGEIAPGQQREVTVTAEAVQCNPLYVDIVAELKCFGTTCRQRTARVDFNTPDPYLLTNNGETADLPMCDVGEVIFTTKNASSDVTLYQLNITETLKQLMPASDKPITVTVYDDQNNPLAQTTSFTPTEIPSGTDEVLLTWRAISATDTAVYTWFQALPPLHVVRIQVPVRTSCVPPDSPQSFAQADALGPCEQKLGYTEDAVTLQTLDPDMTLLKQGMVAGGDLGKTVYAAPSQTVTWRLEVNNRDSARSYVARNVVLSDTWPAFFDVVTYTTDYTPTVNQATRTITWDLGDVEPTEGPRVLMITGTVVLSDDACSDVTTNQARLSYGCDFDGCTSGELPVDTADLDSRPQPQVELSPSAMPICAGDIPITIRNDSAPAYSNTLTVTMPSAGYVYSQVVSSELTITEIITGDRTAPQFTWDRIPGRTTSGPYEFDLVLRVKNSGESGACPLADAKPVTATMQYDDHSSCTATDPQSVSDSDALEVRTPTLEVAKTPRTQTVDQGDSITWTITVDNTGNGIAENVVITDVVSDSYVDVTATVGSPGYGTVYSVTGNLITWTLGSPIAADGTWSATVSAVLTHTGTNRNVVTATAFCDTGCATTSATDTAYSTLLAEFDKGPRIQTGTIGSLTVFTFATTLSDEDALYEDLTITDVLPVGLGYVTSTLVYTPDADNSNTGIVSHTPTITPSGTYTHGNVVWALGDLPGTVQMDGVITAVIQDVSTNQDGVRLTNALTMTYTDDGQDYTYTDTADVDVLEPDVALRKAAASSTGSLSELDGTAFLTYTLRLTNTGSSPAYDVVITDAVPSGISVTALYGGEAGSGPIVGPGTLTWTVAVMSETLPGTNNPLVLSYTARLSGAIASGNEAAETIYLTNLVSATYSSLPGEPFPGEERDYGPITDTATISTTEANVQKSVTPHSSANNLRIGDLVTYTIVDEVPPGLVIPWPYQYDYLPVGFRYVTGTLAVTTNLPFAGSSLTDTLTPPFVSRSDNNDRGVDGDSADQNPNVGPRYNYTQQQAIEWWFQTLNNAGRNTTGLVTITFQAQVVGVDLQGNPVWPDQLTSEGKHNQTYLLWNTEDVGTYTSTVPVNDDHARAGSNVGQPHLDIEKSSIPPSGAYVGASEHITYTLTLTNDGHTPAYDIVISDTLPAGLTYLTSTISSTAPPTIAFTYEPSVSATEVITWRVNELWGTDTDGITKTAIISVVARVTDTIGANLLLTNTARIPYYDSQPSDGPQTGLTPTQRVYTDGVDSVVHRTVDAGIAKSVTPPYATLGDWITYTIRVPEPPITATLYNVTVTDELSDALQLHDVITDGVTGDVSVTGNAFTVTYGSIVSLTQRLITVTAVLSDPLGANRGDVITNVAVLEHRDGGPTPSEETPFTVTEPSLVIDKASDPLEGSTVGAGNTVTYTVRLTNATGVTVSGAHDLVITDTLPVGLRDTTPSVVDLTIDGTSVTGYTDTYSDPNLVVTLPVTEDIPPGGMLLLTYTTRVDSDVQAGIDLTNRAGAVWSSLPGDVPGDRDYGPITDTTTLTTPQATGLTKGVVPPTVTIGSQVVFTVAVPDPEVGAELRNVVFTDVVDSRLRIDAVSPNATDSGQVVTASLPTIPTYTHETIVITTTVRDQISVTAGTQITNQASFDYATSDGPIDSNVVTVTVAEPDVGLSKTVQTPRDPVGAGDLVTYTLTLSNTGDWPAYDLIITDSLPTGLIFDSTQAMTVTDPTTASVGGDYPVYTATQLNVGGYWTITFTARVRDDITASVTLTNAAWGAYDGQPDDNPDERPYKIPTDTAPITTGQPALDLTKQAKPAQVDAGGRLTYTLTVTNSGIVSATGVFITDVIPVNTTFVTATQPHTGPDPDDSAGSVITWALGTLNIGVPQSVTLVVDVDSPLSDGTIITNTGWVTSSESITDTDTVTTPVESAHVVSLTKRADPGVVQAGGALTYTLNWSVGGNETALDVTISDTMPTSTTYQTCEGGNDCGESGGVITWTLGDPVPGASGTVTFTVLVEQPLVSGTVIYNAAIITTSRGFSETDEITTPVESKHTLDVAKTVEPSPTVAPNDLITYTLAYTIAGNEPAYGVTLSDTVPAHTDFVTATTPHSRTGRLVTWPLGDFLTATSGITEQTGVVTMVVRADAPLTDGLAIVNTVLITDTDTPTDTDTVTSTVESSHDITLTKAVDPDIATPGGRLTYTLAYTVSGDGIAPDVTISDTVPTNTAFDSCNGCIRSGDLLTWNLGNIEPPTTGSVTFTVLVDSPLISGTQIVNAAIITDTQNVTDTDTVTTPVGSSHALSVSKSAEPEPAIAGEPLTYTIDWTVTGNEPAFDVTLADTLPGGTTFQACSGAPCGEDSGVITWSLGTQIPPASGAVTLVVAVDAGLGDGPPVLDNHVLISDSTGLTDTDTITTDIELQADLAVTKIDQPDPVVPGTTLTYTLIYTNYGPSDIGTVRITDTLPADVTFQGATPPPNDEAADPLEWFLPGSGGTIVITVTVAPSATETFTNAVGIAPTLPITDPNPDDNTDDEPTDPLVPDLTIEKTVAPGIAVRNMPFTYVIAITNTGAVTFDPLALTDTLPADFHYITGSGNPADPDVIAEPLLAWSDLGVLPPDDSITISFAVTVTPWVTGTFWNVITVTGTTPGDTITDTDEVPVSIEDPVVEVDKQLVDYDQDDVAPNFVTFTIDITNTGPSVIDILPLLDQYDPQNLKFVDATPYPEEDADDGIVTWYDLTGPAPHGFGRNLPPGEGFHLTTIFSVVEEITRTTNTAVVTDAEDIYQNPVNEDDDSEVIVDVPTAIDLLYFRVGDVSGSTVELEWATAVEIDNVGFRLYRAATDEHARAAEVAFVSTKARYGGATYAYTDTVPYAGDWWYWLVDVDTEGKETLHEPVHTGVSETKLPHQLYLPLVLRGR